MADIVIDRAEEVFHTGTQRGYRMFHGIGTFNSTDAAGELAIPFADVLSFELNCIGAPAADENLSVNEVPVLGIIKRKATQRITIQRTGAAKTNALKFAFSIRGR